MHLARWELFYQSCWEWGTDDFSQHSPKMPKMASESFIHALLLFLDLFLKISSWVPLWLVCSLDHEHKGKCDECGSILSSRLWGGALRDDTKNGCVADYRKTALTGYNKMFLLEWHTTPAMKQADGINSGSGIHSCIVVFNKLTGKVLAARDRSCPAGKCGFCKHIAAFCYMNI